MWFFLLILIIVVIPLGLLCLKFGARAVEPTGFGAEPEKVRDEQVRIIMALVITFIGILGGGYIVFSGAYVNGVEKWAAGIVGLVIGYWFR